MVQARNEAQGAIQFHYLAEIAVGTTARVDLCRATSPPHLAGKLLAVKRLHQHIAEDPSFANQFLDEVWMTASLKHPNVVEVAGWGSDDEGMYLAVELLQGVSLARLMKTIFDTGEAFTERMVVYIASRLCRGLAAAHTLRAQNGEPLGLVHRDLTPGNVLVGFNGALKITDFGLAKAKQRLTKTLTGLLKGQPQYMAPEQARGDAIDHRTDLFSLGVLMFELFAGRKPWLAASDFDAVQAILTRPADDLRELRPKIDKELSAVVQRCLEKDPAARFQSANEIQARLDEWLLVHGYQEGNEEALARFVRRNAMRQMRWFERAVAGELVEGRPEPPKASAYTGQNPAFSYKDDSDDDDSDDETDITDAESMVSQLGQRANDPRAARRILDEADLAEEVPTMVLSSSSVPIRAKAGAAPAPAARVAPAPAGVPRIAPAPAPAAKLAPGARPPSRPPPRMPPHPPPVPIGGPAARAPGAPAARLQRPPPAAGAPAASARPLPDLRPIHDSIIDEDSDSRTTAIKPRGARPSGVRTPLIIQTPPREPAPSISDPESEEVPTLPLQGFPTGANRRSSPTSVASPQAGRMPSDPPGQISAPGPNVPPPPPRSQPHAQPLPSLQAVEDDGAGGRAPLNEERLYAEADRFALDAVRFHDEAKIVAARAERQAVISKIAGDAAAIAVEAVRIASTAGIAEASRRLDDAYALEATIRRLAATPLDVPQQTARPGRGTERMLPSAPPSHPSHPSHPSSHAPQAQPSPRDRDPRPSHAPPPSAAHQSGQMPGVRADSNSLLPPPANAHGTGAFDAFEARLRPTIFGLPSLHVAALAIGTFVLVLILMWILMG